MSAEAPCLGDCLLQCLLEERMIQWEKGEVKTQV
jgi:hypothetical protein